MTPNNLLVLHNIPWLGQEFAYKPSLLGGSISYWVSLNDMNSGCVAGVYLVAMNEACDAEADKSGSDPSCPSIDIMQTNSYGFELASHPCANGICDS